MQTSETHLPIPRRNRSFWISALCMAWALAGMVNGGAAWGGVEESTPGETVASPLGAEATASTAEVDRSQLVLELLFDDNLLDTSPGKHTSTAHAAVTFEHGKQGQCAVLDGHSWIDTGVPQVELGEEFTIECWVKPAAQQTQHADIFGNHASTGRGLVMQQDSSNTNEFLAAYGAGDVKWVLTDAVPLLAERWQHVAMVKTGQALQIYVNGLLVTTQEAAAAIANSSMPIAVGHGYEAQERCFRGCIDDFRIWRTALSSFGHAGIDAATARETVALHFGTAPRPVAGAVVESWTLTTDDTRLTLGVTDAGEMVVRELSCPQVGWNWITHPVAIGFWPQAQVGDQSITLRWRFLEATVDDDDSDGRQLKLQFACDDPALELTSCWQARAGTGPIHHSIQIKNRSTQSVTIGEQSTFDLDLTGAVTMCSFHSDGITPDPVGIYHRSLTTDRVGQRHTVRTNPGGAFIPYVVFEANEVHGLYVGLEWSCCRIDAVSLQDDDGATMVRVRGGNVADMRCELGPGATFAARPGFLGTYRGDLDDAGNSLRGWLWRNRVPEFVRHDPDYPKVQWNAFGATGKSPGNWDPVEAKYYPLIDDIAPLGFEEVMIDVGWWAGNEPVSDPVDWPSGMKKAADYAHAKGLRFGLYWTDDLDMADPVQRQQRAARIARLFREYNADMWRSDCTRGEVLGASYAATRGFYEMVDELAKEIPGFQWENCSGGGRIKDYGAMRRAVKIFNSDTYSALHVRQAFYDSSYAIHPAQLEGHLGSVDGLYRPRGVEGIRYAFRSTSMGAPEWFLDAPNGGNGSKPWSQLEKDTLQACVVTYKNKIRPLVREANLYHILPRPDGQNRDAMEYYNPAVGKGAIFLFQPLRDPETDVIRFKGLDARQRYRVRFEDGTRSSCVMSGAELMEQGISVTLDGDEVSELIFFEFAP